MDVRSIVNPRAAILGGFLLLIVGHTAVFLDHVWHLEKFRTHWAPHAATILEYCYAVSILGLIPIVWLLMRLRTEGRELFSDITSWGPIRAWVYCAFLALVGTSVMHAQDLFAYSEFLTRTFFESTLMGCLDLWALVVLSSPVVSLVRLSSLWRALDVLFLNVIVTLLLVEGVVTISARYAMADLPGDATSIEANVEMLRQKPSRRFFNANLNSRGYNDTEFFQATDNDFVIALLADSFGLGVVPYAYNFATVAERHLQDALTGRYERVAVHNFGVPGINMPEYAFILHTEALGTNPRRIVLCVFVGNDIVGLEPKKRRRYIIQNWRLWMLGSRLLAIWRETRQGGRVVDIGSPLEGDQTLPAYIQDPEKEPPGFSEETFLTIESRRLEIANPRKASTREKYRSFFAALSQFHSWLQDKLTVVIIPDEFQVNDDLYARILAMKQNPNDYQRDYPQARIRAFGEERNIPVLDLLPALRAANQEGRVYHLRDTHWNARGNLVAGLEIAKYILIHHGPDANPDKSGR